MQDWVPEAWADLGDSEGVGVSKRREGKHEQEEQRLKFPCADEVS